MLTRKFKVLVVEDDRYISEIISEILKEFELQLSLAYNLKQARENILIENPDIVLSDLMLPDGNGISLAEYIYKRPTNRKIPIVAISAFVDKETIDKALQSGFDDFIGKPFKIEEIKLIVKKYINLINYQ